MEFESFSWDESEVGFQSQVHSLLRDTITCLQCGTCTGSCPVAFAMDYKPREVIRMLQMGLKEKVLSSDTIWVCSFCNTCYTRCPGGVNIPEIMTVLKSLAIKEGIGGDRKEWNFYKAFSKTLDEYGRLFEPELGVRYGASIGLRRLLSDAPLGIEMLRHRKMPLLPHKIKSPKKVSSMMTRIRVAEGE
jgi:heterodisulfide reductase subunit C